MDAEMRVVTIDVFLFCPVVTKFGVPVQSSVKISNSNFHENFSIVHTEGQANYQMDLHLRSAGKRKTKDLQSNHGICSPLPQPGSVYSGYRRVSATYCGLLNIIGA